MIIAGVILSAIGLGLTLYGIYLNNNIEAQLSALFSSGNFDPGTSWIVVGSIILVVGIVLLIVGLTKKPASKSKRKSCRTKPIRNEMKCPHCGKELDGSPAFCPFCGESTTKKKPHEDNACRFCGSILSPGAAFCPACGKRIGEEPVPTPPPAPKSPEPKEPVTSGGWRSPSDDDL